MKTLIGLVMLALGCGAEMPVCEPNEARACTCSNGAAGTEMCSVTGHDFDGCICSEGPCGARVCGYNATTGASCGTCPALYSCTPAGHCAAN